MTSESKTINPWLIITLVIGYILNISILNISHLITDSFLLNFNLEAKHSADTLSKIIKFEHLGILLGCVFFGLYADKKGRLASIFLSIFLYSVFTIASTIISDIDYLYILKFATGFCLSGEFGILMILMIEAFSGKTRTILILVFAAIAPFTLAMTRFLMISFDWKQVYISFSILGFILIFLRISIFESDIFNYIKYKNNKNRIEYYKLLFSKEHVKTFILHLFVILPIFTFYAYNVKYGIGLSSLVKDLYSEDKTALFISVFFFVGNGILMISTKFLKNRKIGIGLFISTNLLTSLLCLFFNLHLENYYLFIFFHIITVSYLYEFFQFSAENFNIFLRGTAIGTLSGLARGSVFPIILLIEYNQKHSIITESKFPFIFQSLLTTLALISILLLKNNYSNDNKS